MIDGFLRPNRGKGLIAFTSRRAAWLHPAGISGGGDSLFRHYSDFDRHRRPVFSIGAQGAFPLLPFGPWPQWILRVVVALPLLVAGVAHFARTALLAAIIPPFFPHRFQLVLVSGVMEFAGAIGLLLPAFTRVASCCLALFMIAIFPANVYGAHQVIGGLRLPGVPVRTAMQIVYIVLLLVAGWGIPWRLHAWSFP